MRWGLIAALVVLCGIAWADDLPKDTNEIKTLDVEHANALAKRGSPLHLNGLSRLSLGVAEALVRHGGWLHLNGLAELSPEVAEALANINWNPRHDAMFTHPEPRLFLNGLALISDQVVDSLAKIRGGGGAISRRTDHDLSATT